MQNFVIFWSDFLEIVCDFLLSTPIIWFVGIFILISLFGFLQKAFNISK